MISFKGPNTNGETVSYNIEHEVEDREIDVPVGYIKTLRVEAKKQNTEAKTKQVLMQLNEETENILPYVIEDDLDDNEFEIYEED